MIAYLDIKVNAAHPNIPLAPFYAFQSSPSNVRILNVPPRIGKWSINAVAVVITLPDNSATTVPAVNVGGCWVATLPGSDVTGYCAAGLQVTASGIDENGAAVDGYCLGIGDVTVLGRDAAIAANGTRYYLHLVDERPENPNTGDTCVIGGVLKYYDGTAWQPFAEAVVVDPTLTIEGAAAGAKATGDALAMKRGVADLGVRGAPTPDNGGQFVVNGVAVQYSAMFGGWNATNATIEYHDGSYSVGGPWGSADFTISAANGYRAVVDSGSETFGTFEIVGVLDTLATTGQTASTADVALAPVYSEWVCDPAHIPVEDLPPDMQYAAPNGITPYVAYADAEGEEIAPGSTQTPVWMAVRPAPFTVEWQNEDERVAYDPSATSITTYSQIVGRSFSATRTIIGYTLGSQTTKPLGAFDNPNFAPVYSASATYAVGALCVHGGVLYRCTSAISTAEAWNSAHWAATTVADALAGKQDALSAAQLANIAAVPNKADASALRYDLVTITTGQLQDRAAQKVTLTAETTTLTLPALTEGKVSDFGIDMVNAYEDSGTPAAASFALDGTIGTDFNIVTADGDDFAEMTALAAGEMAEFQFTRTAFEIDSKPTWRVAKQVVAKYTPTVVTP